jgi:hypothetical protein
VRQKLNISATGNEITKYKHQTSNKFKIQNINVQNMKNTPTICSLPARGALSHFCLEFVYWPLDIICYLGFEI